MGFLGLGLGSAALRLNALVCLGGMARNVFKRVVEWGDAQMPKRYVE